MKELNNYILEKLHLNKDTEVKKYNYYPANLSELSEIVKKLLNERGLNADLNDIDTSKVTDMTALFMPFSFIKNIDISEWNTSNVTKMCHMFNGCDKFNCDLSSWNTSKVTDMTCMFKSCYRFKSDLSSWDVSSVTTLEETFRNCFEFNSDLSSWNVSKVNNMLYLFSRCYKFDSDLSSWKCPKIKIRETCNHIISEATKMNFDKLPKNIKTIYDKSI